ncbi:CaiB/BaiF CoA-transferase family protein [Sphingopyxis sp. JAI128]|uniref:CaiB/BaiF CoA transferase family protein n=1 Tax=Sphingopyxis sp. JAI128 TaxID=2723066 RepID=UPI001620ACA4|nr:CoA transferase [Sphingopyxis sp. JAI128]MBB6426818.1 crotonobetainyl-CoA:carnitine CoA-transferase CaiB-like acyl-CoA transferase [Sphingopyxis sp. JAI128]
MWSAQSKGIAAGDAKKLLEGVRIVDLTSVVFGPYATQILVDLGAEVVKIETPGAGDSFRWTGKAAVTPGMSPGFLAINRGKQSVALDLKVARDLAVMQDLLRGADVFILNVRGKAVERLGLDYETVKALNPGIVYAHCVGFGQDGPYAELQAYDDVIQAATGTASLLPRVDEDPRARYLPSLIADKVAGLHAVYAVLAAIIHKLRTGEGQKVEIPMFEAFSHFMLIEHLAGLTFDPPNAPAGYFRQIDPDRQPFPTSDGFVSIVAYTDDAWPRLFGLLGNPGFLEDERFSTRKLRTANSGLLYREVTRLTPNFTSAELVAKCHAAQLPAQMVRDLSDIMDDPHLSATNFFRPSNHPSEGPYYSMAHPVRFAAPLDTALGNAPLLDEHGPRFRGEPRGK